MNAIFNQVNGFIEFETLSYFPIFNLTKVSWCFFQVRTKSRDSQSSDSAPTAIPPTVLRGVISRMPRGGQMPGPMPGCANLPGVSFRGNQRPQAYQQQQQVIEHDENLSDKEIFPSNNRHDPHAAQVTKLFILFFTSLINVS